MFCTLRPGDTAYSVARRFSVPLKNLLADNGITAPERLPVGFTLIVREPTATYTVRPGDTLFSIARATATPLIELWRNNLFLQGQASVFPGDTLFLNTKGEKRPGVQIGGYAYPFTPSGLLDTTMPFLSCVIPFTYGFRSDGTLLAPNAGTIRSSAAYYGTASLLHLSTLTENDTFSVALAEELFASAEMRETLIDGILAELRRRNYAGVDVDFEFLGARNAGFYADFLSLLHRRLEPLGYPLLVALAPKTRDDQPGTLYEGHDYEAIGAIADAVLLMTYEWGYTYGPPQPISPLGPVTRVLEYALTRIPARKIFLGISDYGYDFTLPYVKGLSKARSLAIDDAILLAGKQNAEIFFDETAKAPYFEYVENGTSHVVWFEDPRSLSARLSLISEYGLRGALYWNFSRRDSGNLALLGELFARTDFNLS